MEMSEFVKTKSCQLFVTGTNLLGLLGFTLFICCLNNLGATSVYSIAITFGTIYLLNFLFLLLLTGPISILNRFKLKPDFQRIAIQLSSYLKEFPLALISFYYFAQYSHLKSTSLFNYFFLLATSVTFSLIGVLNCVLAENISRPAQFLSIFFSFIFRHFYFLSRVMGLALLLSAYNNTVLIYFLFVVYMLILFLIYFIWYWSFCPIETTGFMRRLFRTAFEAFKLLVDFNEKYFSSKRMIRINCIHAEFNVNFVKLICFWFVHLVCQAVFAYFWYFQASVMFDVNMKKTTLFSLLTKSRTRIALVNLYDLESRLRHRQLELISIVGCIVISMLAYHIYYSYYSRTDATVCETTTKSEPKKYAQAQRISTIENARVSMDYNYKMTGQVANADTIDGFSIDTFQQSSSIATSISPSSLVSQNYKLNTIMPCSTCSLYDTDFSSDTSTSKSSESRSFSSLMMTPLEKDLGKKVLYRTCSFVRSKNVQATPFRSLRNKRLDYETSSGVDSSGSSSSCLSSVYNEYLKECMKTPTNRRCDVFNKRPRSVEFTLNNLQVHNSQHNVWDRNFQDKVASWFSSSKIESTPFQTAIKAINNFSPLKMQSNVQVVHNDKSSESFIV